MPPVRGEHVAYGDTGVVIYSNSVCGARSNFEGGPSALSAGLTGRTPRYGFHLDARRAATLVIDVKHTPRDLGDWGALGGIVGRLAGDYWQVPVLTGIERVPGSDEMKHFGAALASYGSVALFHMVGDHAGGAAARKTSSARGRHSDATRSARRTSERCRRAIARASTRSTSSCSRRRSSASSRWGSSPTCSMAAAPPSRCSR